MYTMQTKFVAHIKDPTYHHYKSFPQTCWCPNADGMENPQTITMENPSILGNPAYYGGISGTTLWFILIRELVITFSCQYQGEHDSSVPHTFLVPPPPHTHTHTLMHTPIHSHTQELSLPFQCQPLPLSYLCPHTSSLVPIASKTAHLTLCQAAPMLEQIPPSHRSQPSCSTITLLSPLVSTLHTPPPPPPNTNPPK